MKHIITSFVIFLAATCTYGQTVAETCLDKLKSMSSQGIMFGHHDDTLYGFDWRVNGVSDTYAVCGKYPAVIGFDLAGIEKGKSSYPLISFARIRDEIVKQNARGGYTALSWHCNNPVSGGNAWDISHGEEVVKNLLEGGAYHQFFCQYMDSLAVFLLSLHDDEGNMIPVIFHPFHECHGSWFWWGKSFCTADEYIGLWRLLITYLHDKGVTNVIYAYSPASDFTDAADYLQRYPGDDYVDILGFESYRRTAESVEASRREFIYRVGHNLSVIEPLAEAREKLIALTETGQRNNDDSKWWTRSLLKAIKGHNICYLEVWRNATGDSKECYGCYPGELSERDFIKFSKDSSIIFCK